VSSTGMTRLGELRCTRTSLSRPAADRQFVSAAAAPHYWRRRLRASRASDGSRKAWLLKQAGRPEALPTKRDSSARGQIAGDEESLLPLRDKSGLGVSNGASSDFKLRVLRQLVRLDRETQWKLEDTSQLTKQGDAVGSEDGGDGAPSGSSPESGGKSHIWALGILCFCYLHHSTAGFALPSFLPNISRDLHLADTQSSFLSVGYTALYAVALIPAGLLADKTNRINFLAVAVVLWSGLTMATSKCHGFEDLLLLRVGFAVAQAAQNPVSAFCAFMRRALRFPTMACHFSRYPTHPCRCASA